MTKQGNQQTLDERFMREAIALAQQGRFTTSPNPNVGCVLVKDGAIIGRGYHQKAGEAHAEVNALADVKTSNPSISSEGATAYVTLEPCFHHGRTPPCVDALITAKIRRVVIANVDPNPKVGGQSIAKLKSLGIEVSTDVLADEAYAMNAGFFKRMETGLPLIRVKTAMSLDGKIAMADGESKWISDEASRADVQVLRASASAILSSAKTVLRDDARLNVRLPEITRQPLRVILDRELQLLNSPQLQIFQQAGELVLLHSLGDEVSLPTNDFVADVKLINVPLADGQIDLHAVAKTLAKLGCNEVLVEAGATLAGALFDAQLVDELVVYQAPIMIGQRGQSAFNLERITKLSDAYVFSVAEYSKLGQDLKLIFKKPL